MSLSRRVLWEDEQGCGEEDRRGEEVDMGRPMRGLLRVLWEQ